MKTIKILLFVILLGISCTPCMAGDQFPFLITTLVKTFHTLENYSAKEVEVMVTILTRTDVEPSDRKGSILYALKYHDMLCNAFMRQGWHVTHPLSEKLNACPMVRRAGTLELTFEPRMKRVVMKTFIYPCDKDPLWNMMKYRGGSYDKYFERVANKAETCIKDKYRLRH